MGESEIRQLSAARAARISRLEFDAMVEMFYAADATLMPSGEATVRGIDAIADFWQIDPPDMAPLKDRMLTSVVKRIDLGISRAIGQFREDELAGDILLTIANGGVDYVTGMPADRWSSELQSAKNAVMEGSVVLVLEPTGEIVMLESLLLP